MVQFPHVLLTINVEGDILASPATDKGQISIQKTRTINDPDPAANWAELKDMLDTQNAEEPEDDGGAD